MEVDVHDAIGPVVSNRLSTVRLPVLVSRVVLLGALLSTAPAAALTLDVTHAGPSVVGEAHAFTAQVSGGSGTITYEWQFGETADVQPGPAQTSHAFTAPGLYSIQVFATDATGDWRARSSATWCTTR